MVFPDRLRAARMHAGFTQQHMADMIHLSLRSYQSYEQGRTDPPLRTLVELADILEVPTDWLLGRDGYLESLEVSVDAPRTSPPRRPKPKCSQ